jgi:hypothetical protein
MMLQIFFVIPAILTLLAGCCAQTVLPPHDCVGKVVTIDGLKETRDSTLLGIAIGHPEQGKLCTGQEFEVTKLLTIYRVWDKSRDYSQYGQWWTFEVPEGPEDSWRSTYAVCPEWGPRNIVSKCRLIVGTKIVIGPGQSMKCASTTYPLSSANQVFIPNKLVNDTDYVEKCEDHAWP